jgi:hypothetical protein
MHVLEREITAKMFNFSAILNENSHLPFDIQVQGLSKHTELSRAWIITVTKSTRRNAARFSFLRNYDNYDDYDDFDNLTIIYVCTI